MTTIDQVNVLFAQVPGSSISISPSGFTSLATTSMTDAAPRPNYQFNLARAYDLSVSAAGELNIPVLGGGSASLNQRVVVLEKVAFNKEPQADGSVRHVGYAIRLCLTVSKMEAGLKLSLPFLAASAQLGRTEASWTIQVIGLSGPKVDAAGITPTELNVETFVRAKDSLTKFIEAAYDTTTTHLPAVIAVEGPHKELAVRLERALAEVVGLGYISVREPFSKASSRIVLDVAGMDAMRETYSEVAGTETDDETPSRDAAKRAVEYLKGVRVSLG